MHVKNVVAVFSILALSAMALMVTPAHAQSANKKDANRPMQIGVDRVIKAPVSQTMPILGRFVARQYGVVAALASA